MKIQPKIAVNTKMQVETKVVLVVLMICATLLLSVFGYSFASNLAGVIGGRSVPTQPLVASATYKTATEYIERNGQKYTITIKTNNNTGETTKTITDPTGGVVAELPKPDIKFVDSEVASLVDSYIAGNKASDLIKVIVVFDLNAPTVKASSVAKSQLEVPNEELETSVDANGLPTSIKLNGKVVSTQQFDTYQKDREQKIIVKNQALTKDQSERLKNLLQPSISDIASSPNLAKRKNVLATAFARPSNKSQLEEALKGGASSITLELKPSEIKDLEKFVAETGDKSIIRIEKYTEPVPEAYIPLTPTSGYITSVTKHVGVIDYSFPFGSVGKGDGVGILEADGPCPPLASTDNDIRYSLLDNPVQSTTTPLHSFNIFKILRAVSPESSVYCSPVETPQRILAGNVTLPTNPPIHIITYSFGFVGNNIYQSADRDFDNLVYNHNFAVFKSAGNHGQTDGFVSGPGKGPNGIGVGNYIYNSASSLTIKDSSSWRNPEIGNEKPELSTIGTSIVGIGSGTSYAAPVVAGMAADLLSRDAFFKYRPAVLKAQIMAAATKSVSGGFDKVGVGGADFYGMRYTYTSWSWSSGYVTNVFPNNDSYIDRNITIPANRKVRIVLSWLNNGDFVYNNKHIGANFNLYLYKNGQLLNPSTSVNNSFEVIDLPKSTSQQTHTIRIQRHSLANDGDGVSHDISDSSDVPMLLKMGLVAHYYQ